MKLSAGDCIKLKNGWVLGPLKKRTSTGPGGAESMRFFVLGPVALDWAEDGTTYLHEYDVACTTDLDM
jgi:hypothetical protein